MNVFFLNPQSAKYNERQCIRDSMSISISIITDGSQVILPKINKWRGLSRGKIVSEIKDEIEEILSNKGLSFPTNDLDLECEYKKVLKDYIRPARLMFSGSFSEVRSFCEGLEEYGNVNLYILSERYGLINEKDNIIPYDYNLKNSVLIKNLDKKTAFSEKIKDISSKSDVLIVLLPKQILSYLIENEIFETNRNLKITVCSKSLGLSMADLRFKVFCRPGVARIGIKNKEETIKLIKNYIFNRQP